MKSTSLWIENMEEIGILLDALDRLPRNDRLELRERIEEKLHEIRRCVCEGSEPS